MNGNIRSAHLLALHEQGFEVFEHRWQTTDDFKQQLGFTSYVPKMFRKWSRPVGMNEEGMPLQVWNDTVYLHVGHQLIHDATSNETAGSPEELSRWPVDPIEWALTYSPFPMQVFPYELADDETGKVGQSYLTPVEMMLATIGGFSPVYKSANVWAKLVKSPTAILGLEHTDQPTIVPIGSVLALGINGEPYFMSLDKFHHLYYGEIF